VSVIAAAASAGQPVGMRKRTTRLQLRHETIRALRATDLRRAGGGNAGTLHCTEAGYSLCAGAGCSALAADNCPGVR
jgi:hypothetical protein